MNSDLLQHLQSALGDRYDIEREIGQGGMASVYLARDLKHRRPVALKVLRPELAASMGPGRFLREIEIVAGLNHPHILPLYDSGETDGCLFYVMPLVEGGSLRDRLEREGPLPVDEALRYARETSDALEYAHERGLIHRDIKPGNIMLSGGHALVADFGIAHVASRLDADRLTRSGMSLGTPYYMSPEQAAGEPIAPSADIYALGCVLYEMLAGEPPYSGRNDSAVRARHNLAPIPDVRNVRPTVPDEVQAVIERAMAKMPVDRFSTTGEMARALTGDSAPDRPSKGRRSTKRPYIRSLSRPGRFAAVVAALALIGTVLGLALASRDDAPDVAASAEPVLDGNAVVIVPTVIRGNDSSAAFLRDGLAGLLAPFLDGVAAPRAIDLAEVGDALDAAGFSWEDELSVQEARGIARRLGAGLVLRSTLVGTPGQSVVSAELLDAAGGERVAEARVVAHPDSLARMSDQLISGLFIDYLHEGVRAQQLLSQDPEAIRAYAAGLRVRRGGDPLGSLAHFERAVEIDSTFALAAMAFLDARVWAPDGVVPRETTERMRDVVARHRSKVGDTRADSLISVITIGNNRRANMSGVEFLELARKAVRVAPDRAEAWTILGDHLYHDGAMLEIPDFVDSALVAMRAALDLDPTNDEIASHIMAVSVFRRDTAVLRTWDVRPFESPADFRPFSWPSWQAAFVLGDTATIASVDRLMPEFEWPQYREIIWRAPRTGLGLRQADRAEVLLDAAIYSPPPGEGEPPADWEPYDPWFLGVDLYYYLLNRGQPLRATDLVRRAQPARGWTLFKRMAVGDVLTGMSDTVVARELVTPLREFADSLVAALPAARDAEASDADTLGRSALVRASCALVNWYVLVRDTMRTKGEVDVLRRVGAGATDPWVRNGSKLCADFAGVALSFGRGEPDVEALQALDAFIVKEPAGVGRSHLQRNSLALSYFFAQLGDYERALAATKRRGFDVEENFFLAGMVLQQARMEAKTGDVGAAIRSYDHYLALMSDADRYALPGVEEARAELAELP